MSTVYAVYRVRPRSCRKIACYAISSSSSVARQKGVKEDRTGSHKHEVS